MMHDAINRQCSSHMDTHVHARTPVPQSSLEARTSKGPSSRHEHVGSHSCSCIMLQRRPCSHMAV
jgi:hypothetical protein